MIDDTHKAQTKNKIEQEKEMATGSPISEKSVSGMHLQMRANTSSFIYFMHNITVISRKD